MKQQLPIALVFIFGLFMVFQYFVPHETSEEAYEFLLDWIVIIGIFALGLGIWSLIKVNWDKIAEARRNNTREWFYPCVTMAGLLMIIIPGFYGTKDGVSGFYFLSSEGLQNSFFRQLFNYIIVPAQSTMFALLAFYIASAAYRAFRARNILSTLLLGAALIVMLRFNPYIGPLSPIFADMANWLLNVPNLAAKRAIVIGIGLGVVATAMKVVLGIERGYMGKG
ncbi:MAG: hypothetical protein AAB305_02460 [Candidatus Zixiibacteriota bacterium]